MHRQIFRVHLPVATLTKKLLDGNTDGVSRSDVNGRDAHFTTDYRKQSEPSREALLPNGRDQCTMR